MAARPQSIIRANVNLRRKLKHARFKITKTDAVECGEERPMFLNASNIL